MRLTSTVLALTVLALTALGMTALGLTALGLTALGLTVWHYLDSYRSPFIRHLSISWSVAVHMRFIRSSPIQDSLPEEGQKKGRQRCSLKREE